METILKSLGGIWNMWSDTLTGYPETAIDYVKKAYEGGTSDQSSNKETTKKNKVASMSTVLLPAALLGLLALIFNWVMKR